MVAWGKGGKVVCTSISFGRRRRDQFLKRRVDWKSSSRQQVSPQTDKLAFCFSMLQNLICDAFTSVQVDEVEVILGKFDAIR